MNSLTKVGLVIAGYVIAAGVAAAAVAFHLFTIGGSSSPAYSGMNAFGDSLLFLAVFGSIIGFTAFAFTRHTLPSHIVGTYAYVNPVIAVFAGWAAGTVGLVPPEPIALTTLAGMVVIVAGVALTTTAPTLPPRRPVTPAGEELSEEPLVEPVPSEI